MLISLTPVFHTGMVKPVGGGSQSHGVLISKVCFSANRGGFETGTPPVGQNFEGLGRVTLGLEPVQNSIVTTGALISEPDKKILAICLQSFFTNRGGI